jgi:hypothetical protein
MKKLLCITSLLLVGSITAFADIARPSKTPPQVRSIETNMSIRLDRDAKEARLLIPRSQIKALRAELEQMDDDTGNSLAVTGFGRTQTIVSGLFLSLAFVFGGIWFVRSGKTATKTGKSLVVLAVISGLGSAATFVYANVGPPPEARSITSKLFDQKVMSPYRFASGRIRLETTTESESLTLIVPDPTAKPGEE